MKDQLSALMDGEFAVADSEHLISSAKSGGEMKDSWASYHLIGDAMRGEAYLSHNFSRRVMTAIEAEPTVLAPVVSNAKVAPFKSTKFWSVAASLAAVMFVGMMILQLQFNQSDELSPIEIAQSLPVEYISAHQAAAPSGAAYYIQNASYKEP